MEEFKKYLLQLVGTIEWQDEEKCKAAAKDIMDHFSEEAGNMAKPTPSRERLALP